MAQRSLHLLGSPVLRQRSTEVAAVDDEVRGFIEDLFETMYAWKGVGLAANQVGVARRVAVVDADGQKLALVNPVILRGEGQATEEEGCLSIPDIFAEVSRPDQIVVEALDRDGRPFRIEAGGLLGRAIQHEIDHLDGVLFLDHLGPMKRKTLLARWKRERRGETSYIKDVQPAPARAD